MQTRFGDLIGNGMIKGSVKEEARDVLHLTGEEIRKISQNPKHPLWKAAKAAWKFISRQEYKTNPWKWINCN